MIAFLKTWVCRLLRLESIKVAEVLRYRLEICQEDAIVFRGARDRAQKERDEMSRNLMQLRVMQSDIPSRAGWCVMAFIPEETVKTLRKEKESCLGVPTFVYPKLQGFVTRVTEELVRLAIDGVVYQDRQGKVCALVFSPPGQSPAAPQFVQALYDNEGKFKLSSEDWDVRTEEQRVKSAAGCGGYGVC